MSAPPPYPQGRDILKGKTVLVTASAGTGIGYATAIRCAEEGATVMLSDIHEKRLTEYADRLQDKIGRPVHRTLCNVTSNEQITMMVETAVRETTDDQWLRILDTNLTGTFRCMRAALPVMKAQGGGIIVNMSSICAWRAEAGQTAYAASKAGILALTRCAAIEAAPDNIRINAVVPSLALHPYLEKVSDPAHLQNLIRTNEAFGRSAEPWEIGNTVVFLASDYSSYMTGEALSVSCRRA
jgi:3-oxoacyl-[acyl-carrier protein] reductase